MGQTPMIAMDKQEADRAWDWLTALSPVVMMMVIHYRLSAVWTVLSAAVGCFAGLLLWRLARVMPCRPASALLCGVLVACCLPAQVPAWLCATAGLVGAAVAGIPALFNRFFKKPPLRCPVYLPALTGYLTVRWAFAPHFAGTTLAQAGADVVAGATPLAAMGTAVSDERMQWMFWGFDLSSMGSGPALALFLGCAYLLLHRRVRPLPMAGMLLVVAGAFQWRWGLPAFGLLAGGTLLAAMLLGDGLLLRTGRKGKWIGGIAAGVLAGTVTVYCRMHWGVDGAAVGVLIACVAVSLLCLVYRGWRLLYGFLKGKFAKSEN